MNHKKYLAVLFLLSTIGISLLVLAFIYDVDRKFPEWSIRPLSVYVYISVLFWLPSFFLLFTKEAVYKSWRNFALWFLPFAGLWIALAPSRSGGPFPLPLDNKEDVSLFVSGLFIFISIIIIIKRSIQLRGKKEAESK